MASLGSQSLLVLVVMNQPSNQTSTHKQIGKVMPPCPPQPRVVASSSSAETPASFGRSVSKDRMSSPRLDGSAPRAKPRVSHWKQRQGQSRTRKNSFAKRLRRVTWRSRDRRSGGPLRPILCHHNSRLVRNSNMGARTKLNGAALNGALLIGIFIALGSGDISAGLIIGGLVVVIGVISGDIRPSRRN